MGFKTFLSTIFLLSGLLLQAWTASTANAFVFEDRVSTAKALAHYATGYIYDLNGITNKAILEYEKSVHYDPASYLTHLRLGTNYARLGLIHRAKKELKLVHKYNLDDVQSHHLLALLYSMEKNFEAAAREYEYIIARNPMSDPRNLQIHSFLGQFYYSKNKFTEAISQFEKILDFEPENTDVMYLLGSLYWEVDEHKKAESILRRSIGIDPEHDGSLNTLGYLLTELGLNIDEAIDLVERALEVNPGNGAYLDSLGWAYYKKGDYDKALEYLLKAESILEDPVVYDHIGDVYYKLEQTNKALKYWQRSLKILPNQDAVLEKVEGLKKKKNSQID